jgi:hypothetical protein
MAGVYKGTSPYGNAGATLDMLMFNGTISEPNKQPEPEEFVRRRFKYRLAPSARAFVGTALSDEITRTMTKLQGLEIEAKPLRQRWEAQVAEAKRGRDPSTVARPKALARIERERVKLEAWLELLDEQERATLAEVASSGTYNGPKTQAEYEELRRKENAEEKLFAQFRAEKAKAEAKAAAEKEWAEFLAWRKEHGL